MNHQFAGWIFSLTLFGVSASASPLAAQSPSGPMTPQPGSAIQQAPAQAKIGVSVALVSTPVTVRDSKGQMVNTLDAKDFRITDNGVQQRILHFDMGGDPLSVVVLVETSSRIEALLPQVGKAGIVITQTVLGASGEGAVIGFNDSVDKLQDFTASEDSIENVFTHLQAGTSGSKLYDAMAVGIEMLSGRPQPTADKPGRRRVMLILSEATDVGSGTQFGAVLRQAQLANVTIYSVGLSTTRALLQQEPKQNHTDIAPPGTYPLPPIPGKPPVPEEEDPRLNNTVDLMALAVWAVSHIADKVSAHALEVAAVATGGTHFATFKDRTIERALDEIGGELHTQYTLGYSPAGTTEDGYHEIKVSLADPKYRNLKLRSRPGYYVAASDD